MIELTNEQALRILKDLSRIEGFLISFEAKGWEASELLDYSNDILTSKLRLKENPVD